MKKTIIHKRFEEMIKRKEKLKNNQLVNLKIITSCTKKEEEKEENLSKRKKISFTSLEAEQD